MINYAVLFNSLMKMYRVLPYRYLGGRAFPAVHNLVLLTNKCNLDCQVCLSLKDCQDKEMTLEEVKLIIRKLPKFSMITFSGGEPFSRPDILEILKFSSAYRKCDVFTNGTFLNDRNVSELVKMGSTNFLSNGLISLEVSLRGLRDIHDQMTRKAGSFEETSAGIKRLFLAKKVSKKKYPLIISRTLVSAKNVDNLEKIYELSSELGADICNFILHDKLGFSDESTRFDLSLGSKENLDEKERISPNLLREKFNLIKDSAKKKMTRFCFTPPQMPDTEVFKYYSNRTDLSDYRCYVPWFRCIILTNGDIRLCSGKMVGNLLKDKFSDLWNGRELCGFRKELKEKGIFPACLGCSGMTFIKKAKRADLL